MIHFDAVGKRYPGPRDAWVLSDIDLSIEGREMVFLLGASGAGKSSLLKLITLEERPSKGVVRVLNYASDSIPARKVPELRRRTGVVYQDFRLIRDKTVEENAAYVLRMTGVLDEEVLKERVRTVLTLVGLFAKRREFPESLSGGEQQRAAIARALVHRPSILLADEPTGNLDPEMGIEVMEILRRVNTEGATVIVATHDLELARKFAHRIVTLERGRIARDERVKAPFAFEASVPPPLRSPAPPAASNSGLLAGGAAL